MMKTRNTSVLVWSSIHVILINFACAESLPEEKWTSLFNGRDLNGWSALIGKLPPGQDPDGHITVKDGEIRMYADAQADATVPFGSIVSDRSFSRFHLSFEYAWGVRKFKPRDNAMRDAGFLYHIVDPSKRIAGPWPWSVECQIQEADTADIVCLNTTAVTWMHPDPQSAPAGQGMAGMLPENGGSPRFCGLGEASHTYIGRYPEADKLEGWNVVEAIVHADESAVHIVNGTVRSRMFQIGAKDGTPLRCGRIGFQLEGAEIAYRNIRVRELPEPLTVSSRYATCSHVKNLLPGETTLTVTNPGKQPVDLGLELTGANAKSFTIAVVPEKKFLQPGETATVKVTFIPDGPKGRYSAGLQIGPRDLGAFVVLQGVALEKLEGENEPALQSVVDACGIAVDVGGSELKLDRKAKTIGDGVAVSRFQKAGDGDVRLTPVCRFSPPGAYPVRWVADDGKRQEIATMSSSTAVKDAHQRTFPAFENGQTFAGFDPAALPFRIELVAGKNTATMDGPETVNSTCRIYPVRSCQGRMMRDSFLICFEEASNGDYQDAVFLLENVRPSP